jgi:hypothetical protein
MVVLEIAPLTVSYPPLKTTAVILTVSMSKMKMRD